MRRPALRVDRLSRGSILNSVSFEVKPQEFVCLLGSSGAGKTSVLRAVAGLDAPDGGEISLDGRLATSVSRGVFLPPQRRGIGMVFQSYALWPHMSAYENMAFPLRVRRWSEARIRSRVRAIMDFLRLEGMEGRYPSQLSGGQQQRVALGRALIYEAKLLLLDEPLANVDTRAREEIAAELRQTLRSAGATVLYVTHDQQEALAISDRLILLEAGRVVQEGRGQDLYRRPEHRFTAEFLGGSNVVEGVFRKKSSGGVVELAGAALPWSGAFEDGARVVACLRFRDLALAPAGRGEPPADGWLGRVEDVRYSWEGEQVILNAHGLRLRAYVEPGIAKRGLRMVVTLKPGSLLVFPA